MKKSTLLALLGYFLLTIIMTWPIAQNFTTAIPGDGFDGWQNIWNLWWIKRALLTLRASPYFTYEVYYPTGAPLYFQTLNIFNGLTFLPIALATNLLVTYNVAVLFSFVIGGFGAYLLSLYSLRQHGSARWRPWAAFLAGVVYTFSPYHFAHLLGHLQLISLQWIPFYILFLIRAFDQLSSRQSDSALAQPFSFSNNRYYFSLAWKPALFLILVALCDWYYAFYMVLFTGLALIWTMWRTRSIWSPLITASLVGVLFVIPLSPLLITIVNETRTSDYMLPPEGSAVELSADLLAFISPNEFHPIWGETARNLGSRFSASPSEHIVFAGYLVLGLSLLAVICCWKRARFWAISGLIFFVFSLGPILHVGGQTSFFGLAEIPMPYALIEGLPLLSLARSISRFDVVVMLCLGILAAFSLNWLTHKMAQKHIKRSLIAAVPAITIVIVCFEFLPAPYPTSQPETQPFHYQLAQDSDSYAILDLPMDWDRPANMLYQTVHQKPLISAYTPDFNSRPNPLDITQKTPILQHFRYLEPDIITQDPAAIAPSVLGDLDVRYILLHKSDLPPGDYRETTIGLAEEIFAGWPIAFEDDWLRVYQLPQEAARIPYLTLDDGWGPRHVRTGATARIFNAEASLNITALAAVQQEIIITAQSLSGPQELQISLNGELIDSVKLDLQKAQFVLALPLAAGTNLVLLVGQDEIAVYSINLR